MTKQESIDRAQRVQKLIENEDLKQAFQDVRDAIHQQFERASVDDGETLIRLKQRLHLLNSVQANLEAALRDGRLEADRLEEKVSYLGDKWKLMRKR